MEEYVRAIYSKRTECMTKALSNKYHDGCLYRRIDIHELKETFRKVRNLASAVSNDQTILGTEMDYSLGTKQGYGIF